MLILITTKQLPKLTWGYSRRTGNAFQSQELCRQRARRMCILSMRVSKCSPIHSNRYEQHLYPSCGDFMSHLGQVSSATVTCSSTCIGTQVQGSFLMQLTSCARSTGLEVITGTHKTSTFCLKVRKRKTNLPLGSISLPGSSHTLGILVAYAW